MTTSMTMEHTPSGFGVKNLQNATGGSLPGPARARAKMADSRWKMAGDAQKFIIQHSYFFLRLTTLPSPISFI